MPLGLLPGMTYDEREIEIRPGETILFSSDGVAEAHDPDSEMFGCPRIIAVVESHAESYTLMDRLLEELHRFTGPDWEQEDDITLVTLHRTAGESFAPGSDTDTVSSVSRERVIAQLRVPSEPGNERIAMRDVAEAIAHLGLDDKRVERVKTAVAEATMNAIEHGNENNPDLDVVIEVTASDQALRIRVIDLGGEKEMGEATTPDLDLKLAGEQTPRGWGLFLIKNMVDDMHVETDGRHHIVELVVRLEGEGS